MAYKSDHALGDTSAQYLVLQSAVGHSFGLPADKALQAVTSVPAKALDLDDRVGYARPGYDADLVVWDAHPLSVGATPRQVFIDGVATLDPQQVEASTAHVVTSEGAGGSNHVKHRGAEKPAMRATISPEAKRAVCTRVQEPGRAFVITGIRKSFLDEYPNLLPSARQKGSSDLDGIGDNITLVIDNGQVTCLGVSSASAHDCGPAEAQLYETYDRDNIVTMALQNGHLTRGLVAVTSALGMAEIAMDPTTGDGVANIIPLPKDSSNNNNNHVVPYAKYGVSLDGPRGATVGGTTTSKKKTFARARLGGVTRAVQAPLSQGGLIVGVSTGLRTAAQSTLLNGGLFQEEVALHVALGAEAKDNEGTVSMGIQRLRALVRRAAGMTSRATGEGEEEESSPWARVANGSLPLVIKADSSVSFTWCCSLVQKGRKKLTKRVHHDKHDIQQVILFQKDFPNVRTVILAGREAPLVSSFFPLLFSPIAKSHSSQQDLCVWCLTI